MLSLPAVPPGAVAGGGGVLRLIHKGMNKWSKNRSRESEANLFVKWRVRFPISCLLMNVTACIPKTPFPEGEDL